MEDVWWDMPALLCVIGVAGEVRACNAEWLVRFGIAPEQMKGTSLGEWLSTRHLQDFYAALATPLAPGEQTTFDALFVAGTNQVHPMRWRMKKRPDGVTLGCVAEELPTKPRPNMATPPTGIEPPALLGTELVTLVETSQTEVFTVVDANGLVRYQSPSIAWMTGFLPEEIIGRHGMDLVHPEDQSELQHAMRMAMNSGSTHRGPLEYRWKRKDGSWSWASTTVVFLHKDGKPGGAIMVTRDVTAKRERMDELRERVVGLEQRVSQTGEELEEAHARLGVMAGARITELLVRAFKGLGDVVDDGVALFRSTGSDYERVYMNDAARRLTRGAPGISALGADARDAARETLATGLSTRLRVRELVGYDGRREVEPHLFAVGVELVGALIAEPSSGVKDRLLTLNHELRTPLASTLGYLELASEIAAGEIKSDIESAYSAAQQVRLFIDLGVEHSRLAEPGGEVYLERVNIKGLTQEVRGAWNSVAPNRPGVIWAEEDAGEAYTDRRAMRLVMLALLATQRMDRDWPGATMKVSRSPRSLVLELEPAKEEEAIEITRLVESHALAEVQGTVRGMAAAVAKGLLAKLGGTIRGGRTISASLPSRATLRTPVGGLKALEGIESPTVTKGSRPLALVIDDDPTIHKQMRSCLEPEGWTVVTCVDGVSGLERAKTLRPDVVVLDVVMPSVDGWSVLSKLRSDPSISEIPVVIQSIVVDEDLCLALGASGSMNKPVNPERVRQTLSSFAVSSKVVLCVGVRGRLFEALRVAAQARGMRCVHAADTAATLRALHAPDVAGLAIGPYPLEDPLGLLSQARLERGEIEPRLGVLMMRAGTMDALMETELERWRHASAAEPDEVERAFGRAFPED